MRLPSEIIPIKERTPTLFLQYGRLDVEDGAMVLVDDRGVRMHIPVGGITCILLEPGTTVTHAAVALAAECGTLLLWIGEGGVRLYSSGQPGGARADRLLYQARLALDESSRLKVVRAMYRYRFQEEPARHRSIEQLRGLEGARVRNLYQLIARKYGLTWNRRCYDPKDWEKGDPLNKALSVANHCLYGICEAAILAAGYAPAIGFIHTGTPRSFVFDIADLIKFETVIPVAFQVVARKEPDLARHVRYACRNSFRQHKTLEKLIPLIESILSAGDVTVPKNHPDAVPAPDPIPPTRNETSPIGD